MTFKSTLDWATAQKRSYILHKIRHFFHAKNIIEVETPSLSQGTITDQHLEAFTCQFDFLKIQNSFSQLYLQTSPEFAMKRLLSSGYGDIYQISKAFRNEQAGRYHNPEFTILEWYRLGFDHFQLMDEVGELLQLVLNCGKPTKITYQQLFLNFTGIDPLDTSCSRLLMLLKTHNKLSHWLIKENNLDVLLQVILSEIIEPKIGNEEPYFIYNFPCSQASLAKLSRDDLRVAERFECYYKGIELVNGFNELTDVETQLSRFKQDNMNRKKNGMMEKPIDTNFISALEAGLPKCAGVALGVDRLIMLACNKEKIEEVLTFPISIS